MERPWAAVLICACVRACVQRVDRRFCVRWKCLPFLFQWFFPEFVENPHRVQFTEITNTTDSCLYSTHALWILDAFGNKNRIHLPVSLSTVKLIPAHSSCILLLTFSSSIGCLRNTKKAKNRRVCIGMKIIDSEEAHFGTYLVAFQFLQCLQFFAFVCIQCERIRCRFLSWRNLCWRC